jgi:hypothetical protein
VYSVHVAEEVCRLSGLQVRLTIRDAIPINSMTEPFNGQPNKCPGRADEARTPQLFDALLSSAGEPIIVVGGAPGAQQMAALAAATRANDPGRRLDVYDVTGIVTGSMSAILPRYVIELVERATEEVKRKGGVGNAFGVKGGGVYVSVTRGEGHLVVKLVVCVAHFCQAGILAGRDASGRLQPRVSMPTYLGFALACAAAGKVVASPALLRDRMAVHERLSSQIGGAYAAACCAQRIPPLQAPPNLLPHQPPPRQGSHRSRRSPRPWPSATSRSPRTTRDGGAWRPRS